MIESLRPKSFLIAIASLELLLGTFLSLRPDLAQTRVLTKGDVNILAILFLLGGVGSILTLELRNGLKQLLFIPTILAVSPWLFFVLKALPGGFYPSILVSLLIFLALVLSTKIKTENNTPNSKSLFLIISSLISIIIGLTFLLPFQANHPFLAGLKPYLPPIAIIFLISGSISLKLTEFDTTQNAFFSFLLSLPMLLLGLYFATKGILLSGFLYIIFPLMILGRFILKFYVRDQEDEHPDREHQLLNSYNRILEYASLGSLLIFIVATHSPLFEHVNKTIPTLFILSFAATSIIWFHVLPHRLLSKKQLFLWLNLYSAFIVAVSLLSPQNNPFILLYAIPIFIFSNLFGKREITYPTLIGLLGITLSFFLILFTQNGINLSSLLTLTSNRYFAILTISYIAHKISS